MRSWPERTGTFLIASLIALSTLFAPPQARAEETVRAGGTGSALGLVRRLGDAFERQQRGVRIVVAPSTGSSGGIRAVDRGALDIAVSSRPLRTDELGLGLTGHEFARTPFVLAASASHRGTAFSLNEVIGIYRGDITTWPNGRRIRLVLRPRSDTDTEIMRSLSPGLSAALDEAMGRQGMLMAATDQENADLLMQVPGALGFTSLTQVVTEKRKLAVLTLNGVPPASGGRVNTAYPYLKHLFVVVKQQPRDQVRRFLDFLRSPAARRIIRDAGATAVPFSMEPVP